jgi:hypothetical protein
VDRSGGQLKNDLTDYNFLLHFEREMSNLAAVLINTGDLGYR